MSNRSSFAVLLAIAQGALAAASSAHHSFGAYDTQTEIVIAGEVVRFEWTNPHTRTWLRVPDSNGETVIWELEGMSPDYLGRRGWTRTTLEPGDVAEVTIHPLKSGAPGGTFLRARLGDGRLVVMFGR